MKLCCRYSNIVRSESSNTINLLLDLCESVLEDGFAAPTVFEIISNRLLRTFSLQNWLGGKLSDSALRPSLAHGYLESDLSCTLHSTGIMIHGSLIAPLEQSNFYFLVLTWSSGARVSCPSNLTLQGPARFWASEVRWFGFRSRAFPWYAAILVITTDTIATILITSQFTISKLPLLRVANRGLSHDSWSVRSITLQCVGLAHICTLLASSTLNLRMLHFLNGF